MCSSDPERNAIHLLDKDMEDMCVSKLEKLCTPYFTSVIAFTPRSRAVFRHDECSNRY